MGNVEGLVIGTVIDWLHLLATVAWIGGLFTIIIVTGLTLTYINGVIMVITISKKSR